jgi:predicted RNA-binding protein associated with RNAse of E/G family
MSVLERRYAQTFFETEDFKGHITLLELGKVTKPLFVKYNDKSVCIIENGYLWLQHFPSDKCHSVTTVFDEKGQVVQWFIDICYINGVSEDNVPWMDDLFLDIVVLPTGEVLQLDDEELDEALLNGTIDKTLYNLAKKEADDLNRLIKEDNFTLLKLSEEHKDFLLEKLR